MTRSVGRSAAWTPKRSVEPRPHNGRTNGIAAHAFIARLLRAGIRAPTRRQLLDEAGAEPAVHQPHVYGRAARQRLLGAATVYFGLFVPGDDWDFVAEPPAACECLDLLFSRDGRYRADEIKTGLTDLAGDDLDDQIDRQLAAGRATFGASFDGVRVLYVAAPSCSFSVRPDWTADPLLGDLLA